MAVPRDEIVRPFVEAFSQGKEIGDTNPVRRTGWPRRVDPWQDGIRFWTNTRRDAYLEAFRQHLTAHEGHLSDDSPDIELLLDRLSKTETEVAISAAACCAGCG